MSSTKDGRVVMVADGRARERRVRGRGTSPIIIEGGQYLGDRTGRKARLPWAR